MTADTVVNGTYHGPTDLIGVTDYHMVWTQIDPTTIEVTSTAKILRANGEFLDAQITSVYSGLSTQMPTHQQTGSNTYSNQIYSDNVMSFDWQGTIAPIPDTVPTVSEWGLVLLTLLLLTAGTVVIGRRRRRMPMAA